MTILVKGATIVTQDGARRILRGDILIEGGRISSVAPSIEEKAEFRIDASGKIAMPGLVNAHTHLGMTILRGHGEDLPLHQWLEEKIWPAESRQSALQAGISAKLAFCEMIRGGTTGFADMCLHDPKHVFEAAQQAGLRGLVSRGLMDFNHEEWLPRVMKEAEASLSYGGGRVLPSAAAHSPYTCSEEMIKGIKALARKKGLRFQLHASETRKEIFEVLGKRGKYPYEYLDSIGVMDHESIFAHGGWLTKKEISLAGKRGLTVASCPVSNLKLATGGIAQLVELHKAGANVALGTDGAASNNSLDMFQTMKMASLLQKHHYWKADILPTGSVLDFATRNGARALGFDAGSIEEGKLADVVLLERGPNMAPENDLPANIVYSAGPQNVSDVIIDGKIVMEKRRILSLDQEAVMAEASEAASELLRTGAPRASG
jgi:5-methylthioadenosine/S-adenosylhomocysteine deaminase